MKKLIIDIPEKEYEILKNTSICVVFGVRIDEIIKNGTPLEEELEKIRVKIENHCALAKENHCKYCSYCTNLMGVREILEIIDEYKAEPKGENNEETNN